MNSLNKALFLLVALSSAVPVFAQSDYEVDTFRERAEQGIARAQFNLGAMIRTNFRA